LTVTTKCIKGLDEYSKGEKDPKIINMAKNNSAAMFEDSLFKDVFLTG